MSAFLSVKGYKTYGSFGGFYRFSGRFFGAVLNVTKTDF